MEKPDNFYSRFVRVAKVALPLAALVVLSTLFLFTRTINPSDAIPFADVDVEKIAKDQVLRSPRFSAVTRDGSEITVSADRAMPDPNSDTNLIAENIKADLRTPAGIRYDIDALSGVFDNDENMLGLSDQVRIETSDGYVLTTDSITTDLGQTRLTAPSPITGEAPGGSIEAGRMEVTQEEGTQLLVFKNGVKLIYLPKEK